MANIADLIQNAADWLFMPWVLVVLMGGGVFLTLRLGFVQIRRFREALSVMIASQAQGAGGALSDRKSVV